MRTAVDCTTLTSDDLDLLERPGLVLVEVPSFTTGRLTCNLPAAAADAAPAVAAGGGVEDRLAGLGARGR